MIAKIASLTLLVAASVGFVPVAGAAPVSVDVRIGPPAPRYEVVPGPRAGWVWAPGYWDWYGNRYGWVSGNWIRERPGYVYAQPTWVNHGGRYHFYRGAWARGDFDRDGVSNRRDRDRDNDGVRNRYDRDRDGDGRRNRNDRRPDNPNRR